MAVHKLGLYNSRHVTAGDLLESIIILIMRKRKCEMAFAEIVSEVKRLGWWKDSASRDVSEALRRDTFTLSRAVGKSRLWELAAPVTVQSVCCNTRRLTGGELLCLLARPETLTQAARHTRTNLIENLMLKDVEEMLDQKKRQTQGQKK